MNKVLVLNRARKEVERAETLAADDAKAAHLARQVALAAKIKLKQARKLFKLTRKSARKAEDKSEESAEALDRAQARLEKLQKRIQKKLRKTKPARPAKRSQAARKTPSKPRPVTKKPNLARRAKSKPAKMAKAARPRARKPVTPKTAESVAIVVPEHKFIPPTGGKPDDLNPPSTAGADTPSSDGEEPA